MGLSKLAGNSSGPEDGVTPRRSSCPPSFYPVPPIFHYQRRCGYQGNCELQVLQARLSQREPRHRDSPNTRRVTDSLGATLAATEFAIVLGYRVAVV